MKKTSYVAGVVSLETWYVMDAVYEKPAGGTLVQAELTIPGGVYQRQTATYQYTLSDHLGNARAVISRSTTTVRFTGDYYPFGWGMPGRSSNDINFRYGYQGQEQDAETGYAAFELRMWDGRIGRWMSPDPYGQFASPYLGMGNMPNFSIDPDGGLSIPGIGAAIGNAFRWLFGGWKKIRTGVDHTQANLNTAGTMSTGTSASRITYTYQPSALAAFARSDAGQAMQLANTIQVAQSAQPRLTELNTNFVLQNGYSKLGWFRLPDLIDKLANQNNSFLTGENLVAGAKPGFEKDPEFIGEHIAVFKQIDRVEVTSSTLIIYAKNKTKVNLTVGSIEHGQRIKLARDKDGSLDLFPEGDRAIKHAKILIINGKLRIKIIKTSFIMKIFQGRTWPQ